MPLTRDFRHTVLERAIRDPEFRVGLLTEAIECILNDEIDVAKELLRDYVNATVRFSGTWNSYAKRAEKPHAHARSEGKPEP